MPSAYGVGYLRQTILPVALQLVVSGLVAVVVADLIATFAANRIVAVDQRPARRLRGDAFHAFVLAATVPVLVLASVDGQLTSAKQEATAARGCTRRWRRSTSTSAPTSTITSTRSSRWRRR